MLFDFAPHAPHFFGVFLAKAQGAQRIFFVWFVVINIARKGAGGAKGFFFIWFVGNISV